MNLSQNHKNFIWLFLTTWTLISSTYVFLALQQARRTSIKEAISATRQILETERTIMLWHSSLQKQLETSGKTKTPDAGIDPAALNPHRADFVTIDPETGTGYSRGMQLHGNLKSLSPLNPANTADAWETASIGRFKMGLPETSEIIRAEGNVFIRLMLPVVVDQSCLGCHPGQGFSVGDIGGGIVLTQSAEKFLAEGRTHRMGIVVTGLTGWLLVSIFLTFLARKHSSPKGPVPKGGITNISDAAIEFTPSENDGYREEIRQLIDSEKTSRQAAMDMMHDAEEARRRAEKTQIQSQAAENELREALAELQRFHRLTMGRENRIIELKIEVNGLSKELGRPAEYKNV